MPDYVGNIYSQGATDPMEFVTGALRARQMMNQNMLFQQEFTANKAMGELAQQAMTPNGMDYNKYGLLMSMDPRTSYKAGPVLESLAQRQLIQHEDFSLQLKNAQLELDQFSQAGSNILRTFDSNGMAPPDPSDPSKADLSPLVEQIKILTAHNPGYWHQMQPALQHLAGLNRQEYSQTISNMVQNWQIAQHGIESVQGYGAYETVNPATGAKITHRGMFDRFPTPGQPTAYPTEPATPPPAAPESSGQPPVGGTTMPRQGAPQELGPNTGDTGIGSPTPSPAPYDAAAPEPGVPEPAPFEQTGTPGSTTMPGVAPPMELGPDSAPPGAQPSAAPAPRGFRQLPGEMGESVTSLGPYGEEQFKNVADYEKGLEGRVQAAVDVRNVLHQIQSVSDIVSKAGPGTAIKADIERVTQALGGDQKLVDKWFNLGEMQVLQKYLFQLGSTQMAELFRKLSQRGGTQMEWAQGLMKGAAFEEMDPRAIKYLLDAADQRLQWTIDEGKYYWGGTGANGKYFRGYRDRAKAGESMPSGEKYELPKWSGRVWPQVLQQIQAKEPPMPFPSFPTPSEGQ